MNSFREERDRFACVPGRKHTIVFAKRNMISNRSKHLPGGTDLDEFDKKTVPFGLNFAPSSCALQHSIPLVCMFRGCIPKLARRNQGIHGATVHNSHTEHMMDTDRHCCWAWQRGQNTVA